MSEAERLDLAVRLVESVEHEPSADEEFVLDQAYSVELQRRLEEMARGTGVSHDAFQSLDRIRHEMKAKPTA